MTSIVRLPGGKPSHLVASRQVMRSLSENFRPGEVSGFFAVPLMRTTRLPPPKADVKEAAELRQAVFRWTNERGLLWLEFADQRSAEAYAWWAADGADQ